MTTDDPSLESELCALQPGVLDEALLWRLEAAAEDQLTELTGGERHFEELLRGRAPAGLTPDFLSELEATFRDLPFPVNEKILLFPKGNVLPQEFRKRPVWHVAAAVALIGAATALLMPVSKPSGNPTPNKVASSAETNSVAPLENLIPAGFNRGVSKISDEGVFWKNETQAHSLMRVDYVDKITLKDEYGRTFQVEQPRVRYMVVPAKAD